MESVNEIQNKTKKSLKWTILGEVVGRLITPLTTAILSRILAPEIFGITTAVTMVITFCEIFTDGGFSKYIVQYDFSNEDDKTKSLNVAFWSNFILSILFFALICLFNKSVANIVGASGYEFALIIASTQIPLVAFTSIQTALFRREFKFRNLFFVRVLTAGTNLIISVPMALLNFSYWSIIIGSLAGIVVSTIVMFFMSEWKPKLYFKFSVLKKMFSFSALNLIEAILIWLCTWISSFIIVNKMSQYYLGIYKNSKSMVTSLLGIVTAAIVPVLFSSLSRLKNDEKAFNDMFYRIQKLAAYLILPMGVGLFLYRDLATLILFGSKWGEAAIVVGVYGLGTVLRIIFSNFASEVYRSKGKPIISVIAQALLLLVLVPTCLYTASGPFHIYVIAATLANCSLIIISFLFLKFYFKMPLLPIFRNAIRPTLCCGIMVGVAYGLKIVSFSGIYGYLYDFASILICIIIYFLCCFLFFRKDFIEMIHFFFHRNKNQLKKNSTQE